MGYRSEVGYVLAFPSEELKDTFIAVMKLKGGDIEVAINEVESYTSTKMKFYSDWVKWYDSYDEVQAHQQLLRECLEPPFLGAYGFVRVGEETDDIEYEYAEADDGDVEAPYDDVSVERAVYFA